MSSLKQYKEKAKKNCPRIAFPEGETSRICEAASILANNGYAKPILLGDSEKIFDNGFDLTNCIIIDPSKEQEKKELWAEKYAAELDMTKRMMLKKMSNTLGFAAAMVHFGESDSMASGFVYNTMQTILASTLLIGLKPDVKVNTSFLLTDFPHYKGEAGEDGMIIMADTSLCFADDEYELAEVAINAANGARDMMGWEPRVAMLSFSTKGSGVRDCATKVIKATNIVKERCPELKVDGELQIDAAVVPAVAAKKIGADNVLGGKANILVFPNMDAANIGCKIAQLYADGIQYGPFYNGYKSTVLQMGRSWTLDEILGSNIILASSLDKK